MTELIHPELSYKVVGALYRVYNELGSGYQEKYYQKAIARSFKEEKISFQEQVPISLIYKNKILGRYFIDFVIENKIVLEIKITPRFYQRQIKQVLGYLMQKDLELGILASFTKNGVLHKRILRGFGN